MKGYREQEIKREKIFDTIEISNIDRKKESRPQRKSIKCKIIKFELEEINDPNFVEKVKQLIKAGCGYYVKDFIRSTDEKMMNFTDNSGKKLITILKETDFIEVQKFLIENKF